MNLTSLRLITLLGMLAIATIPGFGQYKGDSTWLSTPKTAKKSLHKKLISPGLTFTQGFTTIEDDSRSDYFVKPSLSGGATLSINPNQWVSLTSGIIHEQHGAGILMPDLVGGIGNGDSTYRTRLRLNTWGVPVGITVRTPVLVDNTRISASCGVTYHRLARAIRIYNSIEDGFHVIDEYTDYFIPKFKTTWWSVGFEIEVPRSVILQVHYVASRSTVNVYQGGPFGSSSGILVNHGLKLSTRF
jgi:hypothetical protein